VTEAAATPDLIEQGDELAARQAYKARKKRLKAISSSYAVRESQYVAMRLISGAIGALGPTAAIQATKAIGRAVALSPISRKRMKRAKEQIRFCFPGWPEERVHWCAITSYEHLLCLGAEVALIPRLITEDGLWAHLKLNDMSPAVDAMTEGRPCIMITGHNGSFEVLGYMIAVMGFPLHALYRPFDSASLDQYMRKSRSSRGLNLVDKFGAAREVPELLKGGAPIGFVADQNGGDRGVFVPFFGRLTSSYKSIGLLAMQHGATIMCGQARRLDQQEVVCGSPRSGLMGLLDVPDASRAIPSCSEFHYSMEVADIFGPDDWKGQPDPLFYITARYRWAIERMVRRNPDQYFWMHKIWRSRPRHERLNRPFPPKLREKLGSLPWLSDEDVDRIVEQSRIDGETLAQTGKEKFD